MEVVGECVLWTGGYNHLGYGQKWHPVRRCSTMAHRVLWELTYGALPDEIQLDHLCRNRGCVNLDHLEPVTVRENRLRSIAAQTTFFCGHPRTPENTYSHGHQSPRCRECRLRQNREWWRRAHSA
jgi:hypothetical protein